MRTVEVIAGGVRVVVKDFDQQTLCNPAIQHLREGDLLGIYGLRPTANTYLFGAGDFTVLYLEQPFTS
jgi:hypothetical protein